MIRLAQIRDLDAVMLIVEKTKKIMHENGNFQWDDKYPLESDFEHDINERSLYVLEENGEIGGFICVNDEEPEEYASAAWQKSGKRLIIHRMAVSPEQRGRGYAGDLFDFAWEKTVEAGAQSIRSDTFSGNIPMNSLFLKHGFSKTGEIILKGKQYQPFNCYEK